MAKRLVKRFSCQDDIVLLKEVIAENPYGVGGRWQIVADHMPFAVDARRCRERTALLLEYFKREDAASLKRLRHRLLYNGLFTFVHISADILFSL